MSPPSDPRPCVLAFDTSTERLAVALRQGARRLHRCTAGGAASSSALLPLVSALLRQADAAMSDIDVIAFGRGPGAFTGLRTACAVAQGLGLGLGRPVLPIDSLAIVAEDARVQVAAPGEGWTVGVAVDARMDEIYAGLYAWKGGIWHVLQPPSLRSLQALLEAWSGVGMHAAAGSALSVFGDRLPLAASTMRISAEEDRGAALLRLAEAAADAGEGIDAADALPLYLRDRVAATTLERNAARAAAAASPSLSVR